MRVVIAGGGNVGTFIGDDLAKAGHDVTIVENDPQRIQLAHQLGEPKGVRWVEADACELTELARADLAGADVVAAVTGDDEDNLVISLLAKQEFAVPRVVARVNNPKNDWMFNEMWGVDVSVSTPHLLTALVEEAVSVGTLVRLLSFEGGRARLSEATLAETSPADGHDIEDLDFPRDSTVVAIIRDDHVIVPRGDTILRKGDEVLVLTSPEAEARVVEILLGPPGPEA
ncbi:MAG: TrkA family potassium uptake protein [Acidimicrobiales bacterium]